MQSVGEQIAHAFSSNIFYQVASKSMLKSRLYDWDKNCRAEIIKCTHPLESRSGRPGRNSCVSLAHKPALSAGRESSCIAPSDPESNIDSTIFITPTFYKYRAPPREIELDSVNSTPITRSMAKQLTLIYVHNKINHSDRTPLCLVTDFVRQDLRGTQCQQL